MNTNVQIYEQNPLKLTIRLNMHVTTKINFLQAAIRNWQLVATNSKHWLDSLGLPSLKGMVEGRRIKFLDKLFVCDGATVIVQTYVNNLAFS